MNAQRSLFRRLRPKIGRPKNLISRAPRRPKIASGAEPAESGTGAEAGPRGVTSSETGSSSPRRVASPDLGVVEEVKNQLSDLMIWNKKMCVRGMISSKCRLRSDLRWVEMSQNADSGRI